MPCSWFLPTSCLFLLDQSWEWNSSSLPHWRWTDSRWVLYGCGQPDLLPFPRGPECDLWLQSVTQWQISGARFPTQYHLWVSQRHITSQLNTAPPHVCLQRRTKIVTSVNSSITVFNLIKFMVKTNLYELILSDLPSVSLLVVPSQSNNMPLTLYCDVESFYPEEMSVSWLQNGTVLPEPPATEQKLDGTYRTRRYYTLSPNQREQGGRVECAVHQPGAVQPVSSSAHLEKMDPQGNNWIWLFEFRTQCSTFLLVELIHGKIPKKKIIQVSCNNHIFCVIFGGTGVLATTFSTCSLFVVFTFRWASSVDEISQSICGYDVYFYSARLSALLWLFLEEEGWWVRTLRELSMPLPV